MTEPIKAGDTCIVIGGASGSHDEANRGRRVIVLSAQGEHSRFGRIWRCRTQDGLPLKIIHGIFVNEGSVGVNEGDFAASWLQKADPQVPGQSTTQKDWELTA